MVFPMSSAPSRFSDFPSDPQLAHIKLPPHSLEAEQSLIGGVLLAAGVALTVAAFLSMSRLAVHVVFDDDGYAVRGVDAEHSGKWLDVTKLTVSEDGGHVTIYHGAVRRTHLLFPGRERTLVDDVLADATARLRQSRL